MAILESKPVRFTPRGVADAFDATDVFPGACRSLNNLVFDQSNPEFVIARPGVGFGQTFPFINPGYVSVHFQIGTRVYGMIATDLTPGFDEPFVYERTTFSFIPVSGVTAGNAEGRPASPPTTGPWIPPTMAIIGIKLIITHPGYTGVGTNFFGVLDITNPAVPVYTTNNTTGMGFTAVPTGVANFNNRAYYIVGNQVWYSDVLDPLMRTNAGQSLTIGDNTPIVALAGLPLQTTSSGVLAALLVFKQTQIWQVTGDAAITGSLALNYLSITVGTSAPRSLAPSPLGTFFAGSDCSYVVSPFGAVVPVTNQLGTLTAIPDIRQPFIYCTEPTRVAAAFSANVYRICLPTLVDGVSGSYDYWFDTRRMRWNGPHSFSYDCISPAGTSFILTTPNVIGRLFQSDTVRHTGSVYRDNQLPYVVSMTTADFPKLGEMEMKQMVESTVELSSSGTPTTYTIIASDEFKTIIAATFVTTPQLGATWGGGSQWGGGGKWTSSLGPPRTYRLAWPNPIVFNKLSLNVTAVAGQNIAIGTFYGRWQKTGYIISYDIPTLSTGVAGTIWDPPLVTPNYTLWDNTLTIWDA